MTVQKPQMDPEAAKLFQQLGIAWSLSSEPYTCPLENRVVPLNPAASPDDEAALALKASTNELRYV